MKASRLAQKIFVCRRRVAGVWRATRAAPDCTRVRREVVRLYQLGIAACLTRQFLRLVDVDEDVLTQGLSDAALSADSPAPPAMLGVTDVPSFHASFNS